MNDIQSSIQFFRQMSGGSWITQGLWVAADLGIADLLADGPRTVEELAKQTQTQSDALYRLMRALASVGVFAQDGHRQFSLTPLAELLRSDAPASQRFFAIMMGAEFHQCWGELLHSVRTGNQGFRKRFGMSFFEYMTENPDRHSIYDLAMTGIHDTETGPVIDAYDFSSFRKMARSHDAPRGWPRTDRRGIPSFILCSRIEAISYRAYSRRSKYRRRLLCLPLPDSGLWVTGRLGEVFGIQ